MKPEGGNFSFVQVASSVSATLYVDDVTDNFELFDFERKEYSNAFLKDLPNADGSGPIFMKNIQGKDVQVEYIGCADNSVRNVLPDDANVNNILRRFTKVTYTIKGGPSAPSAVNSIGLIYKDHMRRYDVFEAYFKLFSQKLSYQYFYNLRNETFNYITSSGLTVTGPSLSLSNVLIRKFSEGFSHFQPATNTVIVKDWSATLEVYLLEDSQRVF